MGKPAAKKKKKKKKAAAEASKGSRAWWMLSLGSAVLGASVSKRALDKSWRVATGKKPPTNPADPEVSTREAVTWVVTSGTVIGLARMLATRRAANYYLRSTGVNPPPPKLPKSAKKA